MRRHWLVLPPLALMTALSFQAARPAPGPSDPGPYAAYLQSSPPCDTSQAAATIDSQPRYVDPGCGVLPFWTWTFTGEVQCDGEYGHVGCFGKNRSYAEWQDAQGAWTQLSYQGEQVFSGSCGAQWVEQESSFSQTDSGLVVDLKAVGAPAGSPLRFRGEVWGKENSGGGSDYVLKKTVYSDTFQAK